MQSLRAWDPPTIGGYELVGLLGVGGMGEVFLGRDRDGRLAAVKVVHDAFARDAEFRTRFAREVVAARKVRGPWTAAALDADPDAPRPWLAAE
jgi:serine/threonine protein kinase